MDNETCFKRSKKNTSQQKHFISISGGSPYPEFSNQELLKKLKSGYKTEKPDNCTQLM